MKTALVVLSSGIGNVIRWTPIIRVLNRLDYDVHLWLRNVDYPEVATLLLGSHYFDRMFFDLNERTVYDVAVFSHWAKDAIGDVVATRKLFVSDDFWRHEGDPGSVQLLAVQLGFEHPLPDPFVVKSQRRFDVPRGTLALHPGCKPGWAWKRWEHFGELSGHFQNVVAVGSDADDDLSEWIPPERNFRGWLPLSDTAALLSECDGLVCNDSGLGHVAAALGIPTFPIHGVTKAAREAMPLPNVHPIEQRADCDLPCLQLRHNARTCPRSIQCLQNLTAATVATIVKTHLPHLK